MITCHRAATVAKSNASDEAWLAAQNAAYAERRAAAAAQLRRERRAMRKSMHYSDAEVSQFLQRRASLMQSGTFDEAELERYFELGFAWVCVCVYVCLCVCVCVCIFVFVCAYVC